MPKEEIALRLTEIYVNHCKNYMLYEEIFKTYKNFLQDLKPASIPVINGGE